MLDSKIEGTVIGVFIMIGMCTIITLILYNISIVYVLIEKKLLCSQSLIEGEEEQNDSGFQDLLDERDSDNDMSENALDTAGQTDRDNQGGPAGRMNSLDTPDQQQAKQIGDTQGGPAERMNSLDTPDQLQRSVRRRGRKRPLKVLHQKR